MQDLHENLMNHITESDLGGDAKYKDLTDTAVKWSHFVLESNTGKALEYGLLIARYLAEYDMAIGK